VPDPMRILSRLGGPLQSREPPASSARGARASPLPLADAHSGSRCDRAGDPRKRYGGGTGAFRLGRTAVGGMIWAGHIRLAARLQKTCTFTRQIRFGRHTWDSLSGRARSGSMSMPTTCMKYALPSHYHG
jgi:hypothetical protein